MSPGFRQAEAVRARPEEQEQQGGDAAGRHRLHQAAEGAAGRGRGGPLHPRAQDRARG